MSSNRPSRFSLGIRKNLNRLGSGGGLRSPPEATSKSPPPISSRYETTVAGPVPNSAPATVETMLAAEAKYSAGENATTALPRGPEAALMVENVDAMDFKKFYEALPTETLEQTNSISQTSTKTETSVASSRLTSETAGTLQESTTAPSSATSRMASSENLNLEEPTYRSWRDDLPETVELVGLGNSTIDGRLQTFYVNKTMDLADARLWDDALAILDKAVQHGYTGGSELKSLFQKRRQDERLSKAITAISKNNWEEAEKEIKVLQDLGHEEAVAELLLYKNDTEIHQVESNLTAALGYHNWAEALEHMNTLKALGLDQRRLDELRVRIDTAEVKSYMTKFQSATTDRKWDTASKIISSVSGLKHIPSIDVHVLEMKEMLQLERRVKTRSTFDQALFECRYADAEALLKHLVGEKTYSGGPPEDIERAEKFYRLMAKKYTQLRLWERAADYWNRLRWLLLDQNEDHGDDLPGQKEKRKEARFEEARAYLRAKKWDSASGMLNLIYKMDLSPLEKAEWTLMKVQNMYWDRLNRMEEERKAGQRLPIEFMSTIKSDCLKAINLLSAVTPEPARLAEAIALMAHICTEAQEHLEAEAYESLLPKQHILLGHTQLSSESGEFLRKWKLSFDLITLECSSPPSEVIKALQHLIQALRHPLEVMPVDELLDVLLYHKIVQHCNGTYPVEEMAPMARIETLIKSVQGKYFYSRIPIHAETLLAAACENRRMDIVGLFLDRGLKVPLGSSRDVLNHEENLILPAAIRSFDQDTIRAVVKKRWHPDDDIRILILAIAMRHEGICNLLIEEYGFSDLNTSVPITCRDIGAVRETLLPKRPPKKKRADDKIPDAVQHSPDTYYPDTALHYAILNNSVPIMDLLLRKGAGMGGRGLYALDWAIWIDSSSLAYDLIARGAKMTAKGKMINGTARKKLLNWKNLKTVEKEALRTSNDYPLQVAS